MEKQGKNKLVTLLNYLIEHNGEHSQELLEVAEEAKSVANDSVQSSIREAARLMDESTKSLKQALQELGKN